MGKLFESINRKNTNCRKWDLSFKEIGVKSEEVLPFWVADSDYPTCPRVKKDIIKRAKHGVYGYSFVSDEYFEILNKWTEEHYNYKVSENNTVLTSGVVNALNLIVRTFTNENDNIVVNPPVYNPFYNVIRNNNRVVLKSGLVRKEIDDYTFKYDIDFIDLESKIKSSKMYILCNPQNPVGKAYTYDELEKIVNLCKKYDCILVSDEIHCDLVMEGYKHTSVGRFFDIYNKIIICTAPSKTFNIAGLGNSNIFFNDLNMHKEFKKAYDDLNIIHNMFGIVATMSAYKNGWDWVKRENIHLSHQKNMVLDFIKEHNLKVSNLEATYLMWIDLSSLNISEDDIIKGLINKKVWVNRGSIYSEDDSIYIRLNVACGKKQLQNGLKLIGEFINKIKNK